MIDALKGKGLGGLELVLGESAVIHYQTIFSLRHMGRVTDLFLYTAKDYLSQSHSVEKEEARTRQCLETAAIAIWAHYSKIEKSRYIELEFGWDQAQCAISIAGFVDQNSFNYSDASGDNASSEEANFKSYLNALSDYGANVVIRHMAQLNFVQIMIILKLGEFKRGEPIVTIAIDTDAANKPTLVDASDAGPVKIPVGQDDVLQGFQGEESQENQAAHQILSGVEQGGDGPLVAKLKARANGEDEPVVIQPDQMEPEVSQVVSSTDVEEDESVSVVAASNAEAVSTEETLVKGSFDELDTTETLVKGVDIAPDDSVTIVKGVPEEADDSVSLVKGTKELADSTVKKLTGTTTKIKDEAIKIAGSPQKIADNSVIRISSESVEQDIEREEKSFKIDHPDTNNEAFVIKSNDGESMLDDEKLTIKSTESAAKATKEVNKIIRDLESNSKTTEEASLEVEKLVASSEKEFESQISIAQKVMEKVQMPDKAREYMNRALSELTKNRAELDTKITEITGKWRAAQLDFKNKQTALGTEIKKLEEQLRQKEVALVKSKETLSRTAKAMEEYKLKALANPDAEVAHKLSQITTLLEKSKEQNEKLQSRLDDVQKKLSTEMAARGAASTENSKLHKQVDDLSRKLAEAEKNKNVVKEDPAMKAELDRANKQIDELKKQQKMLQEKLSQAQNPNKQSGAANGGNANNKSDGPTDAELKLKLEQSQKLHSKLKEDYDKKMKQLEAAKQSETKLRVELAKLQAELKTAQKSVGKKAS